MEFIDERISPLDVLELSTADREKLLEDLCWDGRVGDFFVSGNTPDIKVVELLIDDEPDDYFIGYNGMSKVSYGDCFPLLSIGQLMDFISFDTSLQVTALRGGWMINYDDFAVFHTNDRNALCNLLWQVLKYKVFNVNQPNQLTMEGFKHVKS